ncbi:MAG TPA: amino acid adenylation domain-containing protein, partial [Longimicrobiaceae bacterium]|nr:amino acid adenylation domain-containing protein [Longimicrobiaceae bacterium]
RRRGRVRPEAGAAALPRESAAPERLPAPAEEERHLQPRPETGTRYVAPSGEVQERLAAVWSDLLGFGGVGVHDDFFALGGHSLLATRLVSRVQEEFGVELALDAVFEVPTVAGLAEKVEALLTLGAAGVPPIRPAPRDAPLPLSFAQERMWVLGRLEPGNPMYNVPAGNWLRGPLDVRAAERALAEIVRRHEVLRTVYAETDAGPVQVVLPHVPVALPVEEMPGIPPAERAAAARRKLAEEARIPIDLERGPVMRTRLLRFDREEHVLLITLHHIVVDGWSWALFYYEWEQVYVAYAHGEPSPLPEPAVQYGDYAVWQRELLSGERREEHMAFWRESLRGAPQVLELPTDRPHPPVQRYHGGLHGVELAPALMERVRALAQRQRVTVHLVCIAAFQAVLYRYTGQEDFVMGSLAANRLRPETHRLIGFFINTLAVRARPTGETPFSALLEQVRAWMVAAYAHAEVPLQMVLEELQPERDPSRNPLVQVLLGIQSPTDHGPPPSRPSRIRMDELEDDVPPLGDTGTSKFDLSLLVSEQAELPSTAVAEYNSDLFDRATVERFVEHFRTLLEGAAHAPGTPLAELPLLAPAERAQLLEDWGVAPPVPTEWTALHRVFETWAALAPSAPAVSAGEVAWSFGELNARADRLAGALRALGVGPEARVAVCLERTPELVAAVLGVLKAGGAYVPLDPAQPAERLAAILADSGAATLVTRPALADRLPGFGGAVVDAGADHGAPSPGGQPRAPLPDSLAYVVYTSGSTGAPKGVMVGHAALTRRLLALRDRFGLRAGETFAALASPAFDIWGFETFAPLLAGAQVRLLPPEAVRDADRLAGELATVDAFHAVPALMREVVRRVRSGPGTLPGLRRVFVGGDAIPAELPAEMREAFPAAELWAMYGPTEATIVCAGSVVPAGGAAGHVVGRPLPGASLYVCDAGGTPVPAGVPGELWIGGEGVARGYLGRPELTAERFVPDPFGGVPGARLYRSGDRVRWTADGTLEFLGRTDEQVKVRGYRVEPGEVEAALLAQEGVREAVVVAREQAPGDLRLVAYVVPATGAAPAPAALRAGLRERLPEHMVPAAFVALERLPLNANAKVDRRALPAPEWGGGAEHVAPRTPAEHALAEVWREVLRVERVGVHDRFFEMGGDSILAIRVATAARRAGLEILPRHLFEHGTIAALAQLAGTAAPAAADRGPVTGEAPLTPVQRRFFAQEGPAPHHYDQALLLVPRQPLDGGLLERAVAGLASHHDALRLRFRRGAGGWTQSHAAPGGRAPVVEVDLARLDGAGRGRALAAAADRVQASLDLDRGPIFRVARFAAADGEGERLLLAVHHLAVDGVSWRILLEDLETAYGQLERGEALRLPPRTTSWKEWAERLAEHAGAPEVAAEAGYWLAQAREPAAPLPLDDAGAEDTAGRARIVEAQLDAEETEALLREVPAAYRTRIDEVLLCALGRALARWTGSGRLRVELEGHGREEERFPGVDLSRTVGWFTSVYPVLLDLPGDGGPGEALRAVKEQLRAVPGRGLGYGLLRWGAGGAAAELEEAPAAEVAFNYLGQVDGAVSAGGFFAFAPEGPGASQDPRRARTHRLEVTGVVSGGRLGVAFGYGAAVLRRDTVEALAAGFLEELRGLVAHCRGAEAGGYTPSDFPLAGLGQAALDRLLGRERGVEDVYPMTSMQEGLLFHSLDEPRSGVYVGQLGFVLEGPLDADALERAWRGAVARHAGLRTAFAWEGLPRPVQVVREDAELEFRREDRRGWGAAELDALAEAERARGFDLARPALMRLALVRTGEEEHHLLWTHHHLVLDGWSLSVLFRDVLALYRAHSRGEAAR